MTAAQPEYAARPLVSSFTSPALEPFRNEPDGGLAEARLDRWWKVVPSGADGKSATAARLAPGQSSLAKDPWLVEGTYRGGRVMLCTTPLDGTWDASLVRQPRGEFVMLVHRLVYHLADARAAEYNLQPGQPLRYRLAPDETPDGLTLEPPYRPVLPLAVSGGRRPDAYPAELVRAGQTAQVVYADTAETGVYRLRTGRGRTIYYVVQPDHRESDLAPLADADRERLGEYLPMTVVTERDRLLEGVFGEPPTLGLANTTEELSWVFLVGVVGFLCLEVWLTRRLVQSR
jgi:hypothetical protein